MLSAIELVEEFYPDKQVESHGICSGLPRSGKYIWKMKIFPGQGSQGILWMVREIY